MERSTKPSNLDRAKAKAPRRDGDDSESDVGALLDDPTRDADRTPRIRCPKCRWTPSAHDHWQCTCLHIWNTFDTRGRCPACTRQWHDTMCLRCTQWSPHEEWYEK